MTKAEWSAKIKKEYGLQGFPDLKAKQQTDATHAKEVSDAVLAGKPVPAEVLADYPDLQPSKAPEVKGVVDPHIVGAAGDRGYVLNKYPNARPVKTDRMGEKFPIYEIKAGKKVIGEGHGTTDAWKQAAIAEASRGPATEINRDTPLQAAGAAGRVTPDVIRRVLKDLTGTETPPKHHDCHGRHRWHPRRRADRQPRHH